MDATKSVVTWFEIGVDNLDRAIGYYETLLEKKLKVDTFNAMRMAFFPCGPGLVGGALVAASKSAAKGSETLVYFDCGDDLKAAIARSEKAGGKTVGDVVVLPDTMGSYVHVEDTEGNRVGLHAAS